MNAPSLSLEAREILRALIFGLSLREVDGEWSFGPKSGSVSREATQKLLCDGLLESIKGSAYITEKGRTALADDTKDIIDSSFQWIKSFDLLTGTSSEQ